MLHDSRYNPYPEGTYSRTHQILVGYKVGGMDIDQPKENKRNSPDQVGAITESGNLDKNPLAYFTANADARFVSMLAESIYHREPGGDIDQLIDATEKLDPDAFEAAYRYSENGREWLIIQLAGRCVYDYPDSDGSIAQQFSRIVTQAIDKDKMSILTDVFPDHKKWSAIGLFFAMQAFDITPSGEDACIAVIQSLRDIDHTFPLYRSDIILIY